MTETVATETWHTDLADRLVRWKVPLFGLAIFLSILAYGPAQSLHLDESIESFFAPDDPLLQRFRDSKAWFGGDELLLVGYHDADALEDSRLDALRGFAGELSAVPGIDGSRTQSLAETLQPEGTIARFFTRLPTVREQILDLSENLLVSSDRKTLGIVLRLKPEAQAEVPREVTFAMVRRLAAEHEPPAFVAGEPLQVHDMFRYVDEDSWLMGIASSSLLIAVIVILFRSLRWVLLPLLVVQMALLWTRGLLHVLSIPLSMVSSMLASLVTIIGIATVMHVTVVFREFRATADRETAFRSSIRTLAAPIFWNIVTTMIGFASLLSSTVAPVRSFGLMIAMGTALVLVASMLVLPGGILLGRWDADPRATPSEGRLVGGLHRLTDWLERHHWALLSLNGAILLWGALGLPKLTIETDFSKNFRKNSPIVQALEFFETSLGGAGNWEIHVPAPPALDEETLGKLRALARELRELQLSDGTRLTKVVAITDGVDFIPAIAARTLDEKLAFLAGYQPDFLPSLYNSQAGRMRLLVRSLERQPAEIKLQLIQRVEEIARHHFPEAQVTGLYVLLANIISSLIDDQLSSFLTTAVGIFVCLSMATGSLPIGLISLLPNLFPLLLVIGGMGWFGVPINIGTAMIASVSFGLTVDASLHYLAGYLRLRRAGHDHHSAVLATHGDVGRALVFANLALIFGFAVLSLSNFIPLIYFGVLVSLAMLGGLIGNLVLLPLLLAWIPVPMTSAPNSLTETPGVVDA